MSITPDKASGADNTARASEAERILGMLDGCEDGLKEREREFVIQMRERIEQYGKNTFVSSKQLFWLRDIKDRFL